MRETLPPGARGVPEAIIVRPAVPADARPIATVHVVTWRVAYAHIFEPGWFLLDVQAHKLIAPGPGRGVDVAEEAGEIVGFCASGPARDDDVTGVGEVYALYVAPAHWGRGVGRVLMEAARLALLGHGFSEAVLWVLEDNAQARSFYERSGWVPDGATKTYEAGTIALRYRMALDRKRKVTDEPARTRSFRHRRLTGS